VKTRLAAAVALALLAAPAAVRANGDSATGPPTAFERFVLSACAPCVRESYPVATVSTSPLTLTGFPPRAAGAASRPGQIAVEVVRAQPLGRRDWTSLALRMTLTVTTSGGGDTYPLGTGLLDGADARPLALAVAEMARLAAEPAPDGRAESTDVDFHGGSLRVGVLRLRGGSVAYVQAGDLATLLGRAVWEVPTTLYLPVRELASLAATLGQAAATIEQLRGN
jgi:hypothetical protein